MTTIHIPILKRWNFFNWLIRYCRIFFGIGFIAVRILAVGLSTWWHMMMAPS
jgi:hypothetical protein